MKKWTDEIDNFLRSHCPCKDKKALLALVNETFGTNFSFHALVTNMTNKRIQAGIKPWQSNCGKFRGRQPRPIGAESIKKGFVRVKVAQPNVWKQKQVYIWEQANGREVTKKECVLFLDGNTRNFAIENLECVPRRIQSVLNNMREPTDTPEVLRAKAAIARLKVLRIDKAEQIGLCFPNSRRIRDDIRAKYEEVRQDPVKKEKRKMYAREYQKRRRHEDPVFRNSENAKQRQRRAARKVVNK